MQDNETVTHGLHWLTETRDGWECAHPDCSWHYLNPCVDSIMALAVFDGEHAKLSDPPTSVPT